MTPKTALMVELVDVLARARDQVQLSQSLEGSLLYTMIDCQFLQDRALIGSFDAKDLFSEIFVDKEKCILHVFYMLC